jgi:ABC-type phosphate/phosphonate transport system permease subunit
MKLIKFHIYKLKPNYLELGKFNMADIHDFKVVGFLGYSKHKKSGWQLNSIEYFLLSRLQRFWTNLDLTNKITIVGILVGVITSFVIFYFSKN